MREEQRKAEMHVMSRSVCTQLPLFSGGGDDDEELQALYSLKKKLEDLLFDRPLSRIVKDHSPEDIHHKTVHLFLGQCNGAETSIHISMV